MKIVQNQIDITPKTLSPFVIGVPQTIQLIGDGGSQNKTFFADAGALPACLTLSADGKLKYDGQGSIYDSPVVIKVMDDADHYGAIVY